MTQVEKRIEWKSRYEAWKQSGQSIAEWCRVQEIKTHQMYYWVQQFDGVEDSIESKKTDTQWLAVQMDDHTLHSEGQESIFIHYGDVSVEVRPGVNIELLSDVVHVLQNQC